MEDFPVEEERFIFSYPVWVCMCGGTPPAVMHTPVEGCGDGLLVFTDRAAAEEFLVTCDSGPGVRIAEVRTQAKFADMLSILASEGYTHVVFDDRGRGAGLKRCVVIKELLDQIKKNPV